MSRAFPDEGAARRALQVMEARRSGRETELLHRICRELLRPAELPIVLHGALDQLATHLSSDIAYLRIADHREPTVAIECVHGLSGRELDNLRLWLEQGTRDQPVLSLTAARQERPEDTWARFAITEPEGIDGVLVLDRRASTGPTAVEEHRVIHATASLLGDVVRGRQQLGVVSSPMPRRDDSAAQTTESTAPPKGTPPPARISPRRSLRSQLFAVEREILIEALRDADGNQSRAARALETTPRILTYRLKRHGLHGILTKSGR